MKTAIWLLASIAAYVALHAIATMQRGYDAVGGEAIAAMIPAAVAVAISAWREA